MINNMSIAERMDAIASANAENVVSSIIATYEEIQNVTLFPGDPVRLLLTTLASVIAAQNAVLDWTRKQNYLPYASGAHLDNLVAILGVTRLDAEPAKTTMRYTLALPRSTPTIIPQGTRATADGKNFWATDTMIMIPQSEMFGEVSATCLSRGIGNNGIPPKQINRAVDIVAFVDKVENITTTQGGSNKEDDDALRARARESLGQFSTAGSRMSYAYWALSAHNNIGDVSVCGPNDRGGERLGEVDVFIMLKGGGIPEIDGAELAAVADVLTAENVRPLTDKVNVKPVIARDIEYTVTWYITTQQAAYFSEIQNNLWAAVAEYETWQTGRIGRDVNPDHLIQLCRAAGAKRIELRGLDYAVIEIDTISRIINRGIFAGGVENE